MVAQRLAMPGSQRITVPVAKTHHDVQPLHFMNLPRTSPMRALVLPCPGPSVVLTFPHLLTGQAQSLHTVASPKPGTAPQLKPSSRPSQHIEFRPECISFHSRRSTSKKGPKHKVNRACLKHSTKHPKRSHFDLLEWVDAAAAPALQPGLPPLPLRAQPVQLLRQLQRRAEAAADAAW